MAEGGGGALREVLARFGIDVDTGGLEQGHKEIEGFLGKLKAVAGVVAEAFAFHEVKEFVQSQVEAATELERTAIRLGTTTQKVEQLDAAAGFAGIHAESMNVAMLRLNRSLGEAIHGGGDGARVFHELGIQIRDQSGNARSAADVMEDVADSVSKIEDPTKRARVGMELFGRGYSELLPVLTRGRQGFADARRELEELGGTTTPALIEASKKAEEAQFKLDLAFGNLKKTVAGAIIPAFTTGIKVVTDITKKFLEFAHETTLVRTSLDVLAAVSIYKTGIGIAELAKKFGLLKPTVMETIGALLKFALPIAGILAVYLLLDDFFGLLQGKHSLIGDVIDDLYGVGASKEVVEKLKLEWMDFLGVLQNIKAAFEDLQKFWHARPGSEENFKEDQANQAARIAAGENPFMANLHMMGDRFKKMWAPLSDSSTKAANDRASAERWADYARRFPGGVGGTADRYRQYGYLPSDVAAPTRVQRGEDIPNFVMKIDNHVQIDARGADPSVTKRVVGEGVSTANQQAMSQAKRQHQRS